jgi:4-hydroxybenzoate polyprenyltransferase
MNYNALMPAVKDYITLARPGHWHKNLLVLPGIVFAVERVGGSPVQFLVPALVGFVAICLVSASNYILNEWLDAPYDLHHPIKKNRTAVKKELDSRIIFIIFFLLLFSGIALALFVSMMFAATAVLFSFLAYLYNAPPFRLKDLVLLDVLIESANNPVRMVLGWFMVMEAFALPASLLIAYWFAGTFLMVIKRKLELNIIGDGQAAVNYRRSFKTYTGRNLVSLAYVCAALSLGFLCCFFLNYQRILVPTIPFYVALFMRLFQYRDAHATSFNFPEQLYRDSIFMIFVIGLVGSTIYLLAAA